MDLETIIGLDARLQCAYVDSLLACKGDFIAFSFSFNFYHILQLQMGGIPQFDPVLENRKLFELIVILAFTVFVTQEHSGLKTKLNF